MHRTLGAAPATLLSLRERLIEFAFGSFYLRFSDKPLFLWSIAFQQFFELLPQVKNQMYAANGARQARRNTQINRCNGVGRQDISCLLNRCLASEKELYGSSRSNSTDWQVY